MLPPKLRPLYNHPAGKESTLLPLAVGHCQILEYVILMLKRLCN